MSFPDLAMLNKRFGATGRIAFRAGAGGFPVAVLVGPQGSCEVSLYGGHVLCYRPQGQAPVLFMSRRAVFEMGKPIRGGIPVCWPWFGAHPQDKAQPLHGFARLMPWNLLSAEYSAQMTDIKLGLCDNDATRARWPHAFDLTLRIILDATLRVELTTRNRDKVPFTLTCGCAISPMSPWPASTASATWTRSRARSMPRRRAPSTSTAKPTASTTIPGPTPVP